MLGQSGTQNPYATVGILCPSISYVRAVESILKHLPEAEIVPDFSAGPPGSVYTEERKREFREFLERGGYAWRDVEQSGLTPGEFFSKYGTVAAVSGDGWVQHLALQEHRKVRLLIEVVQDLEKFGLENLLFDAICAPSPFVADRLNFLYGNFGVNAHLCGNYKLDLFPSMAQEAARETLGLTDRKPVALVALTDARSPFSCLQQIASALIRLTDTYQVLLRPHAVTSIFHREELDLFLGTNVRLIHEDVSESVVLAASDLVVSDADDILSGAVSIGKPVVIIDTGVLPDSVPYVETPFDGIIEGKHAQARASAESFDQLIKRAELRVGPVVTVARGLVEWDRLVRAFEDALCGQETYQQGRAALSQTHLHPIDGEAGRRAAECIQRIARKPTSGILAGAKRHTGVLLVMDFLRRTRGSENALSNARHTTLSQDGERYAAMRSMPTLVRLRALIDEFF